MKLFKTSLVALALASAGIANAATLAITNAKVHTMTKQGVLENATVLVEDGKIKAINPANVTADKTFDAQGKILTPGFISSMNILGLMEVSAVSRSRDEGDDAADITFDPSLAFNPKSTLIPHVRRGGITTNVVVPHGGKDIFKGQSFVVNTSGNFDSIVASQTGVYIELGAKSKGSRAVSLQQLTHKLEDAHKALEKAKNAKGDEEPAEPKRDETIINSLLSGDKTLYASASRATDLLALIELKKRFNLDLVLVGAEDAILVAEQIADANVPVVISALENLPQGFDSLHANLENAGKLNKAGVKVVLTTTGDTQLIYELRHTVGIAVANGLDYQAALAAITSNAAETFGLDERGSIAKGQVADLVLWTADPFELSSFAEAVWIEGEAQSLETRLDKLRDRYTTDSDKPRAYIK